MTKCRYVELEYAIFHRTVQASVDDWKPERIEKLASLTDLVMLYRNGNFSRNKAMYGQFLEKLNEI